ncbi:MAG: hypothetical protein SH856_11055 [Flavobacteriales bacterium]|nr:hypothetical protein [Flavobacteriales bacterium]
MKSITFLMVLFALNASAQNLVPNGSFEGYEMCPDAVNSIPLLGGGWTNMFNTPDFLHECALSWGIDVPSNAFVGYQWPKEGSGYVGFIADSKPFTDIDTKEIIGVPLNQSLEVGITYYFSMWLVRSDYEVECQRACNNIGAKLLVGSDYIYLRTGGGQYRTFQH